MRAARLLGVPGGLEDLRVLGPVAELLLGDAPERVTRLDDDLYGLGATVVHIDSALQIARPGRLRGVAGGALRRRDADRLVAAGVSTVTGPADRGRGDPDVDGRRQLQHPPRLDPVPGVERVAVGLADAVVEVGDLLEQRTVAEGELGDPPQRVTGLHRIGGRRRLVGPGTLSHLLGCVGSTIGHGTGQDRRGHGSRRRTGLERRRRSHRRRDRRSRDEHRDHRTDQRRRGTLLRPEPANVRRTPSTQRGDHLDDHREGEREPRDPAHDLDEPDQHGTGHVGAGQHRDDPVDADRSGPHRPAEDPQTHRDPDDERDQQQRRAQSSDHACARA